ncbi:MAG: hypothetical protein EA396_00640 [Anaerolineaceae bacterium]|nr:MAG: hypothetical protein EA396_00640 [Anaerolineaceae bacterium]
MADPQLMQAFDFTADELRANQAGQLSPRQKDILEQTDIQQTLDIGCAFAVAVGVGALLLLACALLFNVGALIASLVNILPLIGAAAVALVVAVIVFQVRGQMERRNQPDVVTLEGAPQIREEEGGYNARYFLTVADKTFRIRPEMYDALTLRLLDEDGQPLPTPEIFRVYYAYRFDKILSVESLTES